MTAETATIITIRNRFDGANLHTVEAPTLRDAVIQLVTDGADLSNADLSDADLSNADLSDARMGRADLSGANMYGANLSCANLHGANLRGADLYGADLSGADLHGADLSDARMGRADLSCANMYGANLRDADLSCANLRGANLRGADLYGADLSGANLRDISLYGAKNAPLIILGLDWTVIINGLGEMQIGCQRHSVERWAAFSERQIAWMANGAPAFWAKHKTMLMAMCESYRHDPDQA